MKNRVASSAGRPDLPMATGLLLAGRLSSFESGEQHQVVGDHGRPDVSPEVIQTAPGAAGAAVGALEPGDRRLDTSAEIAARIWFNRKLIAAWSPGTPRNLASTKHPMQ